MVHLKNYSDTEDIFQTVFLKYVLHSKPFESEEHEKAWIIRVTVNACKDLLKSVFRSQTVPLDTLIETPQAQELQHTELLGAVLSLPPKYKDVVYLYYYEGYQTAEIAEMTGWREGTVRSRLTRARAKLGDLLKGEMQ